MELVPLPENNNVSETVKESPRKRGLRERVKLWSKSTSCHGIPHAGTANSLRGRMLWSLVVIVCVGIFIYQSVQVYKKFQRNEKIVNIEVRNIV